MGLTAPLALAGNAIAVTIHLCIWAVINVKSRFGTGAHMAAMGFARFTLKCE